MHSASCRQLSLAQSTETTFLGLVPLVLSETSALTPSIEDRALAIDSAAAFWLDAETILPNQIPPSRPLR